MRSNVHPRTNNSRARLLQQWQHNGGVMLIGYTIFRMLCLGTHVRKERDRAVFKECLQVQGGGGGGGGGDESARDDEANAWSGVLLCHVWVGMHSTRYGTSLSLSPPA